MARLEDLTPGARVTGVVAGSDASMCREFDLRVARLAEGITTSEVRGQ